MLQILLFLPFRRSLLPTLCLSLLLSLPAVAMPPATLQKWKSTTGNKVFHGSLADNKFVESVVASQQTTNSFISLDTEYIQAFELGPDMTEELQFYTVTFSNMSPGESAYISLNDPTGTFSISMDGGTTYSNNLVIAPSGNAHEVTSSDVSVTVRFLRNEKEPHVTASITHSTAGAEPQTLAVEGAVMRPLPVRLISFDASVQQHSVLLKWKAAADSELLYFELEAAAGQQGDFKKVGVISYSGKEDEYQFEFNPESTGGVHYFRLAQTYYHHPTLYSDVIAIKTNPITQTKVTAHPNPLQNSSKLQVTAAGAGQLKMVIHNSSGKALFDKVYAMTGGVNNIDLEPVQHFAKGFYIITTELNGEVNRIKILKL